MLIHFYDLQRLLGATFSMEEEKAKCHPLTRFALMALARKNNYFYSARWLLIVYLERP